MNVQWEEIKSDCWADYYSGFLFVCFKLVALGIAANGLVSSQLETSVWDGENG